MKINFESEIKKNRIWLERIRHTAEIKTEDEIKRIQSVKGVKFESVTPKSLELDEEVLHFLGMLMGDSCSTKQTSARFGISNTNIHIIKRTREVLENRFFQPVNKIKLEVEHQENITEEQIKEFSDLLKIQKHNIHAKINKTCKKLNFELFVNNRPLKRIVFSQIIPEIPK